MNMSNKGKPHNRKTGDTPAKPYDLDAYWRDTTPNVFDSPAYKATRETVVKIVKGLKPRKREPQPFVTLGAVSREIPRECHWLLEFAIGELESEGVIRSNKGGLRTRIWAA